MTNGPRTPSLTLGLAALSLLLVACGGDTGGGPVLETVAAPVITPAGGSHTGSVSVSIETATTGATIRYTTDGSNPTATSGYEYTSSFTLSRVGTTTVRAAAFRDGMNGSSVVAGTFVISATGQAEAPTFGPTPGSFEAAQSVSLASGTAGADIYYTRTSDGSDPADPTPFDLDQQYIGPFTLTLPGTGTSRTYKIKAIAVAAGMSASPVAEATYVITNTATGSWALKVEGTTVENEWDATEKSVSIQFNLSDVTDFTNGDYTASFDIYIPSDSTAAIKIQTQYPDTIDWSPMYADKYAPFTADSWQTLTYPLTQAGLAYGSLLPDAERFRVVFATEAAGASIVYYLRNLRVTNGTDTPLDISIDSETTVESLGLYVANGLASFSIAQQ